LLRALIKAEDFVAKYPEEAQDRDAILWSYHPVVSRGLPLNGRPPAQRP
jgi:hypothetical protein